MAAEIYVDPSIGSDTGSGSLVDPYGDLEYAIEQETFDTANGTRINVKSGADEVLAAELGVALSDTVTSVAWVPNINGAPLIIQGYTATAGDGGVAGITGAGLVNLIEGNSYNAIQFIDLHLHDWLSNMSGLDNDCSFIRCEINNTPNSAIIADNDTLVLGCYVHDVGGIGIDIVSGFVGYNHLEAGPTNSFTTGIRIALEAYAARNIVDMGGAGTIGIQAGNGCGVMNNSVYGDAGNTGTGIAVSGANEALLLNSNLVEGFSGVGGFGIEFPTTAGIVYFAGNSVYNCETGLDTPTWSVFESGNEVLGSSPFNSASTGDFSPVDTGSVKEGSLPNTIGGGLV